MRVYSEWVSRREGGEENQFFTLMYTLLLLLYTPAPVALCVHGVSIGDGSGGRGNTTRCQQNTASAGMTDDVNGSACLKNEPRNDFVISPVETYKMRPNQ